jgi:hypothetical protein
MKTLNILIGLIGFAILLSLYSGVTAGFSTNQQALIAGGLTVPAVVLLIALIVKGKQAK